MLFRSDQIPGFFDKDNSSGRVIAERDFPIFDVELGKNVFFKDEIVVSDNQTGTSLYWDKNNEILKIVADYDFKENSYILGKSSGSIGIIKKVFSSYTKSEVNSSSIVELGWKKETAKAMEFLKVDDYDIIFDSSLDNRYLDIKPLHTLIGIIESDSKVSLDKVNPTIIAIPTSHSHHQDHVKVFEACIAVLRPMRKRLPKIVLSYEAPEHSRWSRYGIFEPNFYVDIEKHLTNKIKAFYKYRSQIRLGGRDKNSIRAQAEYRGREIGKKYCEAFFLHRYLD